MEYKRINIWQSKLGIGDTRLAAKTLDHRMAFSSQAAFCFCENVYIHPVIKTEKPLSFS